MPQRLLRHIVRCRNARLPGTRLRLWLGKRAVGWITPQTAAEICAAVPDARQDATGLALPNAAAFEAMGEAIAARGLVRRRNEPFSVRAGPDQPELARIDRGALPLLGIWSEGVHVNGLVRRADQTWLWVAERAHHKLLDPGKLDHLVAGGLPAGLSAWDTLCKEAGEEAAVPPALARQAVAVGQTAYVMERPEGLRRDRLHHYDLWVPEDFVPRAADGEVAGFSLWPLRSVLEAVRDTDAFKFNVTLVLIDLFLRFGLVDPAGREGQRLRALLDAPIAS
ncbi:MAG: NUDIX domain-containing protein [Acetobacteraceae bacterium]